MATERFGSTPKDGKHETQEEETVSTRLHTDVLACPMSVKDN